MRSVLILFLFAGYALAGEYAVLASGARLYAERHEVESGTLRLYGKAGTTEMDAAQVVRFEQEDYVAPSAAPSHGADRVAPAQAADPAELVDQAAHKYGLPAAFVRAVMAVESGNRVDAVSPKGAIGLMQLMPSTARDLGADPRVPEQNVDAGTRYLRDLLVKYDQQAYHALAAYNAGPGAVEKYHGVPPYRETQAYIARVLRNWRKLQSGD